jgi:rhodanese-related sulfurtransferase
MKKLIIWTSCLWLVTAAAAAGMQQDPTAAILRISQDEFMKAMKSENVIILDIRDLQAYKAGHIPGAISMPYGEVGSRAAKEMPKDKAIITYCS